MRSGRAEALERIWSCVFESFVMGIVLRFGPGGMPGLLRGRAPDAAGRGELNRISSATFACGWRLINSISA